MNAERRKTIQRALTQLEEAKSLLEAAMEEEQDYYDNLPEAFQNGEKGEKATAAVEALSSAISSVEEAVSSAEEAVE